MGLTRCYKTAVFYILFENASPKSGIPLPPTNRGSKNHLFEPTSQPNGNFNGLYLRKETWYRQSLKCVDNYKGSPTSSQNVMNFGPQTASNSTAIFTHPPWRRSRRLVCRVSQIPNTNWPSTAVVHATPKTCANETAGTPSGSATTLLNKQECRLNAMTWLLRN